MATQIIEAYYRDQYYGGGSIMDGNFINGMWYGNTLKSDFNVMRGQLITKATDDASNAGSVYVLKNIRMVAGGDEFADITIMTVAKKTTLATRAAADQSTVGNWDVIQADLTGIVSIIKYKKPNDGYVDDATGYPTSAYWNALDQIHQQECASTAAGCNTAGEPGDNTWGDTAGGTWDAAMPPEPTTDMMFDQYGQPISGSEPPPPTTTGSGTQNVDYFASGMGGITEIYEGKIVGGVYAGFGRMIKPDESFTGFFDPSNVGKAFGKGAYIKNWWLQHIGIYNRQAFDAAPETPWHFTSFWDEAMPSSGCMNADGTINHADPNCADAGKSSCFQDSAGTVICPDEGANVDHGACMKPDGTIDEACLNEANQQAQCVNTDGTVDPNCTPGPNGANTYDPCMDAATGTVIDGCDPANAHETGGTDPCWDPDTNAARPDCNVACFDSTGTAIPDCDATTAGTDSTGTGTGSSGTNADGTMDTCIDSTGRCLYDCYEFNPACDPCINNTDGNQIAGCDPDNLSGTGGADYNQCPPGVTTC